MLTLRRRIFLKYSVAQRLLNKVILKFQNLRYIICLTPNLLKTLQEFEHYEDTIFSKNEV